MNKTLIVSDVETALAVLAFHIRTGTASTTEMILGELIKASENSIVLYPIQVGFDICKKLEITPVNYRASIAKLTKLKLISKNGSVITLDPIVKTPFDTFAVKPR